MDKWTLYAPPIQTCDVIRMPLVGALFVWSLVAQQGGAPSEIQIHLPVHECSAPCDMDITVSIPKHPDNRSASVVWSYDQSTEWPLGPRVQQIEFHASIGKFDPGVHTIYAVLVRDTRGKQETFQDSQRVTVH